MGFNQSKQLLDEEVQQLMSFTGFSENKLNQLWNRFQVLDVDNKGYITREDLMRIEALEINPLADRIVDSFLDGNDHIRFEKFTRVLATFQQVKSSHHGGGDLNSRTEKLKFVFGMYDTNGDGRITKQELLEVLVMMVGTNVTTDQLRMIAERTILDSSPLSRVITFENFEKVMTDAVIESKMVVKFQS